VIGAGLAWGAAVVGFGLSGSLAVALVFLALAGMADLISEVLRNALLQRYTPDSLRGRVSSLYLAQVTTAPSVGNVEAGLVAQLFTVTVSVSAAAGLRCRSAHTGGSQPGAPARDPGLGGDDGLGGERAQEAPVRA